MSIEGRIRRLEDELRPKKPLPPPKYVINTLDGAIVCGGNIEEEESRKPEHKD